MKILEAKENKIFAYKDENGNEIILGEIIYLGKNDDGSRYYEIDKPENKEGVEDDRHNDTN